MTPAFRSSTDLAAELFARIAHDGQTDKAGEPYLDHLRRVAHSPYVTTSEQWQAAWLHDVYEDTNFSESHLEGIGISEDVIEAVHLLTHWPGQTRASYIEGIKTNPIALAVKKADNRDNADPARISRILDESIRNRLATKYRNEWEQLNSPPQRNTTAA